MRPFRLAYFVLPLLLAAAAVALSVYITILAVLILLWAADAAFALGALGGAVWGVWLLITEGLAKGLMPISVGCILGGLAIFLFFGCLYATRGVLSGTKRLFHKKEGST